MKNFIFLLILVQTTNSLFSQGLNNKYPIDNTDLTNIFEIQNIEIFKFPINEIKESEYLNIIIEQYINKKLEYTSSTSIVYKDLVKNIGCDVLPKWSQYEDNYVRFYFHKKEKTLSISYDFNGNSQHITLQFSKIKMFGSRAFDVDSKVIDSRKRILSYYGVKNSKKELHCAGNSTNQELLSSMDNFIIVYLEPIKCL